MSERNSNSVDDGFLHDYELALKLVNRGQKHLLPTVITNKANLARIIEQLELREVKNISVLSEKHGMQHWYEPEKFPEAKQWPRFFAHLRIAKRWHLEQLEALNSSTTKILNLMPDPGSLPTAQAKGLVVGYVQSGKTTNFTGLIAKAVDGGYDLIIVLAGLHNNLRRQTQRRLDIELTGNNQDSTAQAVAPPPIGARWQALTSAELDFKNLQDSTFLQSNAPIYAIIKKNCTVLQNLDNWLSEEPDICALKKVLVIDDEADHGTINTNPTKNESDELPNDEEEEPDDAELDPTRTNELIRSILGKFKFCTYVGYTATPFANVLIDPYEDHKKFGPGLYPKDFIVSLDKPQNYVGPEELFPEAEATSTEEWKLSIISPDDAATLNRGGDDTVGIHFGLPEVIIEALYDFILTGAVKKNRGASQKHHSMLIHAHHKVEMQSLITEKIKLLLRSIQSGLKDKITPFGKKLRRDISERWKKGFEGYFPETKEKFSQFEGTLSDFADGINVREINYDKGEDLDYENYPNGLAVIAIGGNRLSRGLTLEGLTISVFTRYTRKYLYDTLLQMGRWFGFRPGYNDLVRLYLTSELLENFSWLVRVERQIRADIARYERLGKSPMDLAVRVMAHKNMRPTAKNKMRNAIQTNALREGGVQYTLYFHYDKPTILQTNLRKTGEFLGSLGTHRNIDEHYYWHNVPAAKVLTWIENIKYPENSGEFDKAGIIDHVRLANEIEELTSWTVSLVNLSSGHLASVGKYKVGMVERTRLGTSNSIGSLIDRKFLAMDLPGFPDQYLVNGQYDYNRILDARLDAAPVINIYLLDASSKPQRKLRGKNSRRALFEPAQTKINIVAFSVAIPRLRKNNEKDEQNYHVVKGLRHE